MNKSYSEDKSNLVVLLTVVIFTVALATRVWRLNSPNAVVHDEIHSAYHIGLYLQRRFYIDSDPPLVPLVCSGIALYTQWNINWTAHKVGAVYPPSVQVWPLRCLTAVCGSLLVPLSYIIMCQLNCDYFIALLAPVLIVTDAAMLTQSRFIFTDVIFLLFVGLALLSSLKLISYSKSSNSVYWWFWLINTGLFLGLVISAKYIGFMSLILIDVIVLKDFWDKLPQTSVTNVKLIKEWIYEACCIFFLPSVVYCIIFYVHLNILQNSGPHDDLMTSSFQASLQGGLSSLTDGQPEYVAYGSQVTIRPTHGEQCWLHSYQNTYPIRYSDGRGSSHQQQVVCCRQKNVNNWWLVKHPQRNYIHIDKPPDLVKHEDVIQLVHGMTSRALHSHDVGAPVSPQFQEVSGYIDYNISSPAMNLWQVDITNRDIYGIYWLPVKSEVRLVHLNTSCALKTTGIELPVWGKRHFEVVADKFHQQKSTIWNIEEHRYIPTPQNNNSTIMGDNINSAGSLNNIKHSSVILKENTNITKDYINIHELGFWSKFVEVHLKILSPPSSSAGHKFSSRPLEWLFCDRNVPYWKSVISSKQIHLVGNLVTWYSVTLSVILYVILLVFYLVRRQRSLIDHSQEIMGKFFSFGKVCLLGYILHILPYFFTERSLYLHNYLPALFFGVLLITGELDHCSSILKRYPLLYTSYHSGIILWISIIVYIFLKLLPICYGHIALTKQQLEDLLLKESWDFML